MDPVAITLTAVGWLMSTLVNKAVTGLLEAWAKRTGLGDDFKTLKHWLLLIGALLTSARGIRTDNGLLEELVQELQQLAYQAENLLDELDYYRLEEKIQQGGTQEEVNYSNKSSAAFSSSGFRLATHSILSTLKGMSCCSAQSDVQGSENRINLSQRMKDLVEQLQKSEEKVRNAVQIEALVKPVRYTEISTSEATNIRQTSSFLTEPEFFGRDQELGQLMNILTNKETAKVGKVPVLAIVGSGGLGKTTLARLVFNDPKVHSYFEVRSWICVSTQFDCVRLTREMLESACGTRCDLTNLNELQNKLIKELGSKRFLLVLDDMWEDKDKSQWDSMVAPLNNCMGNGSIILVTTRNHNVAKMVDAGDNIIPLKGLDENAFLSFFSKCIFNDTNYGGNWRLRNIGQQIANKLKGNPLAAKTVSALLKENRDEIYWIEIRDSEEWKTQNSSNHIMPALRLSYEHMPFHLQRCFSYCAIFPEDHPFTCEELVYLWMAQGYLDASSEGKRMEDIGRAYFNDLFNRGFFQTVEVTYTNEVHYTFHDLIHNLACAVSFKECFSINGAVTKEIKIPQTIRHFSMFNGTRKDKREEIVTALAGLEGENLGTIFIRDELHIRIFHITRSIWDLVKKTKFLRVARLDNSVQLHNCNFQNFVSLRYLRLIMLSNQKTLPREICRLYHLEVLEIEGVGHLDELPNNFSDLVSLRHFIISYNPWMHSKICGVGKLTSLQELNYFDVQQKKGFEIEQLGSLKEIGGSLCISKLENVKSDEEASKARLAEKGKLDTLYLKWNHGEKENESVLEGLKPNTNLKLLEIHGYGGVVSPTWLDTSLIFLESLTLMNCKAWEMLPPIGEFEFLKKLKLSELPVREIGPQCYGTRQSMKFRSLEELEIIDMPDLEKWVWSDQLQQFQGFKKLIKLTIRDCKAWELLPPIGELESLKHLKLSALPVREIGPQCYGTHQSMKFQSLEELEITDMPDLEKWVWSDQLQQFQCFKKLIKLTIRNCKAWELLPPIGEFESLKHLKLSQLPMREIGLHCYGTRQSMIFQSLEELEITDMPDLEKWVWSDQLQQFLCFRKLKKLSIRDCPKLVDLPLLGSTSEVLERFPSLESLEMVQNSSLEMGEVLLAFHEHSSLRYLDISHISSMESFHENLVIPHLKFLNISHIYSLESLDLNSFVALEDLKITECQSLTSLTFGEHLVYLKTLHIASCKALSSMKGLKSWVNLQEILFRECPGFIAAWETALKEIERTEPDFSLSLKAIIGDSLSLLTLPICKQLTSLQFFVLKVSAFTEEHKVSLQLLKSIDLVDIEGCKKNLESFPFDLFPSLKKLLIKFPHIQSLTTSSRNEITEECVKLRNIKDVHIFDGPVQIWFKPS